MKRMFLFEISANGEYWTEQWLYPNELNYLRRKGYHVRCPFCRELEKLNEINDSALMTAGDYAEIRVNVNGDKNKVIVGYGDSDVTPPFPMNFCPKCGRSL